MALFYLNDMPSEILYFESLQSTNTTAYDLARKGAVHGKVVWAKSQTGGKGRLGKKWSSPVGKGLYFSIILRPDLALEEYPKLTLTAGLAVAELLEKECGVSVGLKWPNDVYISDKKCCGILAEAALAKEESEPFAVIGIGLNVLTEHNDFPEDIRETATSLLLETKVFFSLKELLKKLSEYILVLVTEHETHGFATILKRWRKYDFLRGKTLEWVTSKGEVICGKSLGLDQSGKILVRDDSGKIHEVLSGDLSLAATKKGANDK